MMTIKKSLSPAIFLVALITLVSACSDRGGSHDADAEKSPQSGSEPPVAQLGERIAPVRYQIELRIDPSQETFAGNVAIDLSINEASDSLWLHGKNLDVSEVYLTTGDGERINGSYEEHLASGVALITLDQTANSGPATLHVRYTAPFNSTTNALFKMLRGGDAYAATQFEPIAARQVFPGFDEPGFKVPFDLSIIARADDVVVTTTPEISVEALGDGYVKHRFKTTRPMPTYLLAFAVGPYDLVDYGSIPANSVRDRPLQLRAIAAKGQGERLAYALENTDGLLSVLEEYFDIPYPYEKLDLIAVPESFGGAMENIGAIVYDEYLLLMDEDSPLNQRRAYTRVHAHELGHMWFGNLVTPAWWNDIWLNESFATWIMYKAAESYWPEGEFSREVLKGALGAMRNDSLAAAREIREPIDHNDKISGAFDGITYQKGGGVLAMLERYVGEERFQTGVRLHLDRHAHRTATAEDFMQSLAEGTERTEIEAAFKSYIEQPGVPLLSVRLDCTNETEPQLVVQQSRYAPLGSAIDSTGSEWQVPACFSFVINGEQSSSCALISEREQTISLEADSCPTRLLPNADGAGYYRFSLDDSGWQELIDDATALPAAEALVLGDSLDAAFRAGKVSADTYVSGMAALARHSAWDVAGAATGHFEAITSIVPASELQPVEKAFRDIVRPLYDTLADNDDSAAILQQQSMQRFLIVMAKDPDMRAPLARQAAARLGLNGEPDLTAAPADQLETIFSVGVQDLGEPFFDLLLEQASASEDPAFRGAATGALARVEDPVLVARLQSAVLEEKFKGTEMLGIVFRQMIRDATTDLTYAWLRENDEALIGMIPETFRSSIIPAFGQAFCTEERADEWQAFITSHADKLPGYERNLAQAIESIHLCAALRAAKGPELIAAFDSYGR